MAQGACYAQPYDKLRRNIRIEGETMRKDHVGRITPRLNKFPYRYVYVRLRCKFTRDLRRAWRRRMVVVASASGIELAEEGEGREEGEKGTWKASYSVGRAFVAAFYARYETKEWNSHCPEWYCPWEHCNRSSLDEWAGNREARSKDGGDGCCCVHEQIRRADFYCQPPLPRAL